MVRVSEHSGSQSAVVSLRRRVNPVRYRSRAACRSPRGRSPVATAAAIGTLAAPSASASAATRAAALAAAAAFALAVAAGALANETLVLAFAGVQNLALRLLALAHTCVLAPRGSCDSTRLLSKELARELLCRLRVATLVKSFLLMGS